MAMLGLPTSAAEPEHAPMPGSDRVGAQPRAAPDRDIIDTSANPRGEAMLTDFYVAFATVCFTLLACGSSWSRPAMPSAAVPQSIDGGHMGSPCTSRCPG